MTTTQDDTVLVYRGFHIRPYRNGTYFINGRNVTEGFMVSGPNGLNLGPGAAFCTSIDEACVVVDDLILAGAKYPGDHYDPDLFWHLHGHSGITSVANPNDRQNGTFAPTIRQFAEHSAKPKVTLEGGKATVNISEFTDPLVLLATANAMRDAAKFMLGSR